MPDRSLSSQTSNHISLTVTELATLSLVCLYTSAQGARPPCPHTNPHKTPHFSTLLFYVASLAYHYFSAFGDNYVPNYNPSKFTS